MATRSKLAITRAALQALTKIERDLSAAFPEAQRLPVLRAHLSTVVMTVEHIRDEDERETTP